jgi:multisubunit Na+/H+ antiporter MnhF subunit
MEKLPPEKAAEMLRKKGMEVSVEQAALMLALLRMLSGIIVATYLEQGRYP